MAGDFEVTNPEYMKTARFIIIPSAALLLALLVYNGNKPSASSTPSPNASSTKAGGIPSSPIHKPSLASKGMLWEKVAKNERERAVKSMQVNADSFAQAMIKDVGSSVMLHLSNEFSEIQAQITYRDTTSDGTVVTNLVLPGTPQGQLTIQKNAGLDFFLAQLYYDNHPVAYEFKENAEGMIATRHELSELLCSMLDRQEGEVKQMGLPPVDRERGKKSDEADQAAIAKAKKLLQEAKGGGTTGGTSGGSTGSGITISITDAIAAERNSGTSILTFTVKLSKTDRFKTISVNYSTVNGTAIGADDYVAKSGTVSIPAGKNSAAISITLNGDTNIESDETFFVNLSNPVNATISDSQAVGTITNDDVAPSVVPVFNSLPGAVAVAYLDMDGQIVSGTNWAGGATITARGLVGTLSNAQMLEICNRTAEDFSPFAINVTTEESVFLAAPSNRRIRCIITPDNEWFGSAGGVAYLNSFTWTGDTPCWVFSDQLSNSPRYIAEASSHEIGHTLSLLHDGRISPSEAYYQGHGTGEIGWAPIMGVGYYKLLVQWSKGEYLSANNLEDDLSRITTLNGFSYRVDQVGGTTATAKPLTGVIGARSASGILETVGDLDVFSFSTTGGSCSFTALGDASSQNVDVLLEILDSNSAVVASANPDALTDATVSATLAAGSYFLRVSGVGRGDVLLDGYSNYGGIGQYTINGDAP
jgi:hypothetical protein